MNKALWENVWKYKHKPIHRERTTHITGQLICVDIQMVKLNLKTKVSDRQFQYKLKTSPDVVLVHICGFQFKSMTSYCAYKVTFGDGQKYLQRDGRTDRRMQR